MNRIQNFRADLTQTSPGPNSLQPGALWVNFADHQVGFIDALKTAQKLVAVRFFATSANYNLNEIVVHNGAIWVALGPIPAGAFNSAQWSQIAPFTGGTDGGGGAFLPLAGGQMLGSLFLAHDPTYDTEAATKHYVDTMGGGGGGGGGPYLLLSGGTMTGDLILFRDPSTPFGAATKAYVDAHAGSGGGGAYLPLAGGTMTGPIVLAADPTTPSQAANKHYVDTALASGGGIAGNCPTGFIGDFPSVTPPAGWVKCDGSAYLSTDPLYVALFGVIGTAFGSAPGGYFKVPDLRNRMTVGAGQTYTLGNIGGAATVILSVAQMATHKHTDTTGHTHTVYQDQHKHALTGNTSAVGVGSGIDPTFQLVDAPGPAPALIDFSGVTTDYQTPTVYCQLGYSVVDNTGSSQAHENMPPYMALTKIIKL